MSTPIKASEVGAQIYQILVDVIEREYAGETEAVKQEAIFDILTAVTYQMFKFK